MNTKKKYYLTRRGFNYETNEDNPLLEKWIPKYHSNEDVLTVKIFPRDFHISSYNRMPFNGKKKEKEEESKRGKIKKFTLSSIRRLRFLLRNTIVKMEYELGLTYPKEFPTDGLLVKKHFHKLRMRLNYYEYRYIWVLEFQERGAPHFHMLIDKEITEEKLSKMWYDIVKSGDIKHLGHGVHVGKIRSKERMSHYFVKYLSKQEQKSVPEEYLNVGRFWGASRNLLECTVKKFYGNTEDIRELKKQVRPMRRWYNAQKRSWGKKWKPKGKRLKNKYMRHGASFKVINSDLFINDLRNRNLDTSLYES